MRLFLSSIFFFVAFASIQSQSNLILNSANNSAVFVNTNEIDSIYFGTTGQFSYLIYGDGKYVITKLADIDSLYFSDYVLPQVVTTSAEYVHSTGKINCVANLMDNGGCSIDEKGICWSCTNSMPTVEDSIYSYSSAATKFYGILPASDISKTYYVRAFATNCIGTSYGEVIKVQPLMGNVSYSFDQSVIDAGPTVVNLLTQALDSACYYYNRYTPFKTNIWIYYNAGIPTAQASYHGSIGFGASQSYMWVGTVMHEMAHYFGSGTSWAWQNLMLNGVWQGTAGQSVCKQLTGAELHGDNNGNPIHYWPTGINYRSEVGSATDLINHAKVIKAMLVDDCKLPTSW